MELAGEPLTGFDIPVSDVIDVLSWKPIRYDARRMYWRFRSRGKHIRGDSCMAPWTESMVVDRLRLK